MSAAIHPPADYCRKTARAFAGMILLLIVIALALSGCTVAFELPSKAGVTRVSHTFPAPAGYAK